MIVCLEGISGSGKTSLGKIIAGRWAAAGRGTAAAIEPVQSTDFGRSLWEAIMGHADLDPDAETLAFVSARLEAARQLRPLAQDLVLLERWAGAVVVYGKAGGADPRLTAVLENLLRDALKIDLSIVVDVPGRVAGSRLRRQHGVNRFETRGDEYLEQARQHYLEWGRRWSLPVVDGTLSDSENTAWADHLVQDILDGFIGRPSA